MKTGINKSVGVHDSSLNPHTQIQRSAFGIRKKRMQPMDADYLNVVMAEEVLPGDTWNLQMESFTRLQTPIVPFMDNLYIRYYAFFCPNRQIWTNWPKFMGEQASPGDSTDYVVPMIQECQGYAIGSLQEQMGLPNAELITGAGFEHMNLYPRAYAKTYNDWFRDENLVTPAHLDLDDGPDTVTDYVLRKKGKGFDYFTSLLIEPQKGEAITLPLGTLAPVRGIGITPGSVYTAGLYNGSIEYGGTIGAGDALAVGSAIGTNLRIQENPDEPDTPNIYADLNEALPPNINSIRTAIALQQLAERNARGGTRYTEILRSHFDVISDDQRLARVEYLGGSTTPIAVHPIAQTSETDGGTPQGNLAAFAQGSAHLSFTGSFKEHGILLILCCINAELTYQQGLPRKFSRKFKNDYAWPTLANIGEQAVLDKEIYITGVEADDNRVFGYGPRYDEYRTFPSEIIGQFKTSTPFPLDMWHLSQFFGDSPGLNAAFITCDTPVDRVIAVTDEPQFKSDMFFQGRVVRALPIHGIPGLLRF